MNPEDVPVETVTDAEFAEVRARLVAEVGLTFEELAERATPDDDVLSEAERRVWFAIKPLPQFPPNR